MASVFEPLQKEMQHIQGWNYKFWIIRQQFMLICSLISIMGMLALAGVVVNDSLILVEWINRKVHSGMSIHDAVRSAGVARFRPILLTSLTTFFGLTPLILEKSTQAQFLIPMAVSLGFGILYATLISLILIPAGYLILQDLLGSSSSPKRP